MLIMNKIALLGLGLFTVVGGSKDKFKLTNGSICMWVNKEVVQSQLN